MPARSRRIFSSFARSLGLASCLIALAVASFGQAAATKGGAQATDKAPAPSTVRTGPLPASHKLQPMDLLRLQVFQEPEMGGDLRVTPGHVIVVPLIGEIDVRNKTVRDLELLLVERYKNGYLVNPKVNITVMEYAPRTVTVLGAVNSPGSIAIPPERELNVLEAVARAGGFTRNANLGKVMINRTLPDGTVQPYTVNAELLMSGDNGNAWTVQDGDIINVIERRI